MRQGEAFGLAANSWGLTRMAYVVALLLGLVIAATEAHSSPAVEERRVSTAFLELRVRVYRGLVDAAQFGGGVAPVGDRYLLAARTGELYVFGWDSGTDELRFEPLRHRVPLNIGEFKEAVGGEVNHVWFRVADVAVQEIDDRLRLFVSHHRWNDDEACFVARVSMIDGSHDDLLGDGRELTWKRVFDTQPCLRIQTGNRGHPFQGNHIAGRLAPVDEQRILLTVGDHGFDGWNAEPALPQDGSNSYGKTLQIEVETGASEIVSRGHRNPQGLHVDDDGTIWLTEHGPKGGDELNLVRRGANYGWPLVTYGTNPKSHDWPLSKQQGSHDGYEQPFYSWTPSIAISNLVRARGSVFTPWRGDLLVSSLNDMSIWRVRVRDERVVYTERIRLDHRIRDIDQGADGRIVLWTDQGALILLEPSAAP